MKKGIIFDMDGTLWDSAENVAISWNIALDKVGFQREPITKDDKQIGFIKAVRVDDDKWIGYILENGTLETDVNLNNCYAINLE